MSATIPRRESCHVGFDDETVFQLGEASERQAAGDAEQVVGEG